MHFTFEYPAAFVLLIFVPCFYFCRKSGSVIFLPKLEWLPKKNRFFHKMVLIRITIFIFGVFALAMPVSYAGVLPDWKKGVAIVLALDASGSMRESGFSKNELSKFELLQKIAEDFIDKRRGDNIGVVAFGTFAFTASPVSYDLEGVKSLLDMLEVEIAGKNTAIGEAISQSVRTLSKSKAKEKIIVLVSDGKNNSGAISPKDALSEAKKRGIKIFTIFLGSLKDHDGTLLKKISEQSGAEAFNAKNADELKKIYKKIDTLLPSNIRAFSYQQKRAYYHFFLLVSLLLLFWYIYLQKEYA